MEFKATYSSNIAAGAREDAEAVGELRKQLEAASGGTDKLAKAAGAKVSPTTGAAAPSQALVTRSAAPAPKAPSAAAGKAKGGNLAKGAGEAGGHIAGGAKLALGALGAAAGIAGAASLARLALGIKGMATLQMLGQRTQLQTRQMFSRVDSGPAIRAADRFLNSIFSGSSAAGKALSGIFTRGFNSGFSLLEKAQPAATAFFQGMIWGALQMELAYLKARTALAPVTVAIERYLGPAGQLETVAYGGAIALGALAVSAAVVAAPFVAAAAAVTVLLTEITKLRNAWDDSSIGQIGRKIKQDLGLTSQKEAEDRILAKARPDNMGSPAQTAPAAGKPAAANATPLGKASGKAYAQGVQQGVADGAGAAADAGGALAKAVDKGFRDKAQIKSPSRVAEKSAGYWPEGVVRAVDRGAPAVQAASDRMVPTLGSPAAGGGAPARGGATVKIEQVFNINGGDKSEIMATIERANQRLVRELAIALGAPVDLSAAGGAPA